MADATAPLRAAAAPSADEDLRQLEQSDLSLLEVLDHVLDKGLVLAGEITISVAEIDLIFVGLNVLLGSVETIERTLGQRAACLAGAPPAAPARKAVPEEER